MNKISLFLGLILLSCPVIAFDVKHEKWTELLKKYTAKDGFQTRVHYGALKKSGVTELDIYLAELSSVNKQDYSSMAKSDQLSFLINSYNAFTVKLILDHYPVNSIKDIGNFLSGPWKKDFFTLLGEKRNLDNIEHDMIRKKFSEPRIHFAVNCASIGCPELLREAFTGHELESQLSKVEKDFFTDPEKVKVKGASVKLSKILDWYGKDFFPKYGSLKNYVKLKGEEYKLWEKAPKDLSISFLNYNWDLNGK